MPVPVRMSKLHPLTQMRQRQSAPGQGRGYRASAGIGIRSCALYGTEGSILKAVEACAILPVVGVWRSLVAHLHGVQGVGGSSPLTPTTQ